jgi:hypothetical protein
MNGMATTAIAAETAPYRGGVIDVSRPATPWRWTSVVRLPFELLAVAWGAGLLIVLLVLAVGLVLAAVLWVVRLLAG